MDDALECPRPVRTRDVEVVIGVLAILETGLLTSQFEVGVQDQLSRRFSSAGLTVEGASGQDLRQAVDDLNQRLRYALGEYDEPPRPMPVP